jgi:hypothetical protein
MNPPTAGHEQVVKQIKDTAKEVGGDHTSDSFSLTQY